MIEFRHKVGEPLFFSGDSHFLHTNIIRFCDRPFHDVDEMDGTLVTLWNHVVGEDDVVYHLGDFAIGPNGKVKEILGMLNGRIRLCEGSHEKSALAGANRQLFDAVADSYYLTFYDEGGERVRSIFLSHFLHKIWPASHYDSIHLFGHSHGRMDKYSVAEGQLLDVGVDSHEFRPWTLDEVVEVMGTRPLNSNSLQRRRRD